MTGTVKTSTAFPLGVFVGNPNGNDPTANAQFESQFTAFEQQLGAKPQFMDGFTDFGQDPSQWATNASWTAWSWSLTGNQYVGPGSGVTPVVGVPLSSNTGGWGNVDTFFQQIVAGTYDADYQGIVDSWAGHGYSAIQLRLGYEFNGNFMPWGPGNSGSPTVDQDFTAAWQHVANLVHAEGAKDGIAVQTVWNPTDINWDPTSPAQLYPGNQYVDIISTDAYSPTYELDLTNWTSASGSGQIGQAPDPTTWAQSATNREHFWTYPDGSQWNPTPSFGQGWSLNDAIAFAKANGKPLSISETGAGNFSTGGQGPVDDPAFPQWLAGELQSAEAQGVTVTNVDIWDVDVGDGSWGFTGGEKPQEAAAWTQYFGDPANSLDPPAEQNVPVASGDATLFTTSMTPGIIDKIDSAAPIELGTQFSSSVNGHINGVRFYKGPEDTGPHTVYLFDANGDVLATATSTFSSETTNGWQEVDFSHPVSITTGTTYTVAYQSSTGYYSQEMNAFNSAYTKGPLTVPANGGVYTSTVGSDPTQTYDGANYYVDPVFSSSLAPVGPPVSLKAVIGSDKFSLTVPASTTRDGDVFTLKGTTANVVMGRSNQNLQFTGGSSITISGNSNYAYVSADCGNNTFIAGSGGLEVKGGPGNNTFEFLANSGHLTIDDFNAANDTLLVASSLKAVKETHTSAGSILTFGPSQQILLNGTANFNVTAIKWI